MSEEAKNSGSEALRRIEESIEKDEDLNSRKKDLQEKKLLVDTYKYTNELERIRKGEEDIKKVSQVNVGILTEQDILDLKNKNRSYLEAAKNCMEFLNKDFSKLAPLFPGTLALVGARTGGGKSSLTANLMVSTLRQINPLTGNNRKVLCISSEEQPFMCYNRLSCHILNLNFDSQDEFTDEQKQKLVDCTEHWARMGITVIGEDGSGLTNTIEGINSIFENLMKTNTYYDLILIDYIQKVTSSRKNPNMKPHEVLRETMYLLDNYKNQMNSAIVVMSQLSSQKSEDEVELDFQDRLRGCKDLITPATLAIELIPDYKLRKSTFIIRKNRYKGNMVGGKIHFGYDRGKFVPYTEEFKKSISSSNENEEYDDTIGKHTSEKQSNKE